MACGNACAKRTAATVVADRVDDDREVGDSVGLYTDAKKRAYSEAERVYRSRRLAVSFWPGSQDLHELLDDTVPDWLRRNACEVPDRLALVEGVPSPACRRHWTYAELLRDAERVASALLDRFIPGERIGVMAPSVAEYVVLQYGIALAGLTLVTVNPSYHDREVEHILATAQVAGVFAAREWRGNRIRAVVDGLRPALPDLRWVWDLAELPDLMAAAAPRQLPHVRPDDPCVIMFTSGTTGLAKGALLNQRGMTNSTRFMALRAGLPEGGVWIGVMPMQHMGGNGFSVLGTLQQQGTLVLVDGFEPGLFCELTEAYRGDYALLVPTMLEAVLAHPDRSKYDLSSLRFIQSGASMVSADLVRRVHSEISCQMSIVCGQTESHGGYSQTHLDDSPEDQAQTIGQPYPRIDFKIADPESGAVLPLGRDGEICIRGYQVMAGYFHDPDATACVIDEQGWLHSGDLGVMDERGFVRFSGRLRDVVIRGGVNIYPAEIENLLLEHPDVAEAAIIGIPDSCWGEQVAALIVPKRLDEPPDIHELDGYCLEHLARFKRPRSYAFVPEFPVTCTGKLRRYMLRDALAAGEYELHSV